MVKIGLKHIAQQVVQKAGNTVKNVYSNHGTQNVKQTLTRDVVEINGVQKTAASNISASAMPDVQLTKHLTELGKKKVFNREILALLTRNRNENGELIYHPEQREIISAAVKKVNRLKNIAHKLADDGKRAEKEAYEEIRNLFGAKYKDSIEHRSKSKESTFDKLVNHLRENIDKFRNELYKEHFKGTYKKATEEDKNKFHSMIMEGKISLSENQWKKLGKLFARSKQEYRDSKLVVMDQMGTRLLLPTGSKKETEEVTDIIEKAIKAQKIRVIRVSNYSKDGIKPYISNKRIAGWQELDHRIPTLVNYDKSKDNGYTTFQMNVIHKNGIPGEFQLRSKKMNIVCNGEHTFYDMLENKDISKGVSELQEYYEQSGLVKLVQELKEDPVSFSSYMTYIKDSYKKTRDTALGADYPMPVITNYIDDKYAKLSLENLCKIADDVKEIQKKYPAIFG